MFFGPVSWSRTATCPHHNRSEKTKTQLKKDTKHIRNVSIHSFGFNQTGHNKQMKKEGR
jgi:hypothetical protein